MFGRQLISIMDRAYGYPNMANLYAGEAYMVDIDMRHGHDIDMREARERSRDRERRRDRDRDRGDRRRRSDRRDRDDDRDRGRDRHNDDYDYYNDHDNYDSSRSSDGYENRRGEREDRDRAGERWMSESPTNTILLRGLKGDVDEKDLRCELMLFGAPVKDVRLMKRKDTGASRGFAFVEFQDTADSQRWMDHCQGRLYIQDQFSGHMYYSTPKSNGPGGAQPSPDNKDLWKQDWICSKCGVHNFKRREQCFKCNITREESERAITGDGYDQVGTNPCNTLIFRGLDALTTEENLTTALQRVTALQIKNIHVTRDQLTGTSRGFAFVEMSSVQESSQLLESLQRLNPQLEVDGKVLIVSFAKNTFTTVMATLNQSQYDYSQYYQVDQNGQYYDPQTGQVYDYSQYYSQDYDQSQPQTQSDSANAAAAVAQAAIQQAQAVKHMYTKAETSTTTSTTVQSATIQQPPVSTTTTSTQQTLTSTGAQQPSEYPTYEVPDVSTYQFDETSGYYYDPLTGLYYDANSQYYYNSQTGQFLYWDGDKQTYLPAPTSEQGDQAGGNKDDGKGPKDRDRKDKVKIAKKIAKDMEKWAKTLNAQKAATRDGFKFSFSVGQPKITERESATADAGFAILEKVGTGAERAQEKLMPPPPPMGSQSKEGLVASYGGDSDSEEEEDPLTAEENKLLDYSKMACLLCKRQFPNKEALQRHQQLSDLHKSNLEELRKAKGIPLVSASQQAQYRDRAKERREKYGTAEPPLPRKKRNQAAPPVPFEQPTKQGIGGDNIGNKMLKQMGWSPGQGLGKAGQGITDPIMAQQRQQQAGLGSRGSSYDVQPGDTYKETVKKMMFARYKEAE